MTADLAALLLIVGTAPAITLFTVLYGLTTKWWQQWIGRALFLSSMGLALLVDISLLYRVLGDDYALRDVVRLTVYSIIFLGAWFKLIALGVTRYQDRRDS